MSLLIQCIGHRQRREHHVFIALLQAVPGLEERLMNGTQEDAVAIGELVSHTVRLEPVVDPILMS